jgi:putative beta-lysine N-acetyltransferase
VPSFAGPIFEGEGYVEEAAVPNLFNGEEDGLFLGKYLDPLREMDTSIEKIEAIIATAEEKSWLFPEIPEPIDSTVVIRPIEPSETPILANLYQLVFESYPFPIHRPDYLADSMQSHVRYFGAFDDDDLVAASSAEIDQDARNVELTDFATLPEHRGRGLAQRLLQTMEDAMRDAEIITGYTIARAYSKGMNIVFARQGYQYGGTLINNTNICGQIESMNVWHKSFEQPIPDSIVPPIM